MKILLLTQWFDPEPFYKGLPFAKALSELGHEVIVLTGYPNYPNGKIYPGYSIKLFQYDNFGSIKVIRVPLYPSHDRNPVKRILNYVSFAISASILGPLLIKDVDVIYAYQTPVTIGIPAIVLRFFKRAPIVYDIQDMWPESVRASEMLTNRFALYCLNLLCNFIYKSVDKIVVQSKGFKRILEEKGVDPHKIEIIYNWCDDRVINPGNSVIEFEEKRLLKGKFNIIYAGNIGRAQGLHSIIEAAEILKNIYKDIQFVFVGDGTDLPDLKNYVQDKGINNVIFIGRKPMKNISAILQEADVLLVHLKEDPLFNVTIPSKLQAYMAMGKPILAGVRGEAREIIEMAKAGISCEPCDHVSIADSAIMMFLMEREQLTEMGLNGLRFYKENMSLEIGVKKFEKVFKEVLEKSMQRKES